MSQYYEAKQIEDIINQVCSTETDEAVVNKIKDAIAAQLKTIKPSNVKETIYGKWEHLDGDEWFCTHCGYVISTEGSWEHPLSHDKQKFFCEHCGADMRKENDGEEIH